MALKDIPSDLFPTVNPDETSLNANGFVGVDPIYQNFANATDEPLAEIESDEDESDEGDAKDNAKDSAPETPKSPAAAKK